MANNETKITIKADNKQFLKAIKECTDKIKDFTSAAGKIEFKADNNEAKGKIEEVGRLLQTLKSSVIKISADNSGAKMVIEEIALGLQSLKAKPIQIDADISGAKVKLTELAGQLQEMKSSTLTVNLTGADSGNIKLELDSAQVNSSIAEIKSALEGIVAPEIRLDVDVSQAKESIEALSSQLNAPKADGIKIEVDADQGKKELEDLEKSLNGLEAAHVKVNLDATDAIRDLGVIDTRLRGLLQDANAHVNVDSAEALQDVEALLRELKKIQSKNVRIDLNANVTEAEIERINTLLIKLKSRSIDVRIDTADAAERLRELRSMAVEVRQALSKIRIPDLNASGVTALGAALQRLEKQAQETQRRLSQVHAPSGSGGNVSAAADGIIGGEGILGALSKVTAAGASAVAVLGGVKDAAGAVVMPGFNFTKDMETAKLGIAGVLSSMATMNGEAIDFNDALGMSGDIFTKLQKDAVKTSATTAELVETFRAVLAPGLNAGMSIDEIQKFTTVGVNAVKSMGLPKDQIVQELGDLISGDISIDSTVAKNLGLKKEDIDNAKNSAEGLFAFLEARMSGLAQAAGKFPDTLAGKLSALDEASTMASAKLTEAFEPEIKALLGMITGFITDINTQTGELEVNPKILDVIESLKGGLDTVLSLFGEINSETGNFEFNEGTQDFIDGLGEGLKEVWELVESLFYSLDQLLNNDSFSYIDHWLAVLGDLWDILTDIISIIGDAITVIGNLGGKVLEVTGPFQKEFANAMRWAVEQLKEFIDMAKIGWEWLAKWSGGSAKDQPTKKKSWADFKREEDTNTKIPATSTGNVRAKYADSGESAAKAAENAEKERIKASQNALKDYKKMLQYQQASALVDIEQKASEIEQKHKANPNGDELEYFVQSSQLDIDKIGIQLATAEQIRGKIEGAEFQDSGDKQAELNDIDLDIKKLKIALKNATENMEQLGQASSDSGEAIFSAAEKFLGMEYNMGGNGDWATGTDCGKLTMDAYAAAGLALARRTADAQLAQMEDAGGFYNDKSKLKKGDLVFYDTKYMPVSNDRSAVNSNDQAYKANHVGIYQGDGKVLHAGSSTGVAENVDMDFAEIVGFGDYTSIGGKAGKQRIKATQEKASKYGEFINNLFEEGDKVVAEATEAMGDISTQQIADIETEYGDLIEKFRNNHMPQKYIDAAEKVKTSKVNQINFAQTQKDLEYAQNELVDTQQRLYYDLESGAKDSTQITEEYLAQCKTLFSGKLAELQAQLDDAISKGDKDLARDIKNKIKDVINTIGDGIKAILDKIDSEANREIEKIQMNKGMTNMQKDDAIDAVRRGANRDKVGSLSKELNDLTGLSSILDEEGKKQYAKDHNGLSIDKEIIQTQKELEYLNYQIEQTPTLLDKVNIAGKQAFEDGLLDFLTRGINDCENLGEAFRNLAVTVLEAIQRMYAEALVKNIMGALFPANNVPASNKSADNSGFDMSFGYDPNDLEWWKKIPGLAEGGSTTQGDNGGLIKGPGTGTSDSILGWIGDKLVKISNGEFVFNADAVKRIGLNTLQRMNSGDIHNLQIPIPKFASGGAIGNVGADATARGMAAFSQDLGVNVSPNLHVNAYVDGQRIFDKYGKDLIKVETRKEILNNLKMYNQLGKRFK